MIVENERLVLFRVEGYGRQLIPVQSAQNQDLVQLLVVELDKPAIGSNSHPIS